MKNKFELEHIGINTANPEEAEKLAQLLSLMFNLEPRHGQKSEFGGPYFCLLYTSPSPRDTERSRMPSSA